MKRILFMLMVVSLLGACSEEQEIDPIHQVDWKKRTANLKAEDSLASGMTYLSVYSQIYSQTEHKSHNLTATVSLRNTNLSDTVFVTKAEYFNTEGHSVRTYFEDPIYLAPMETVEIVIAEMDKQGGTGGNFLFTWKTRPGKNEPLFEAVMITTSMHQGLSFSTVGKRIQ